MILIISFRRRTFLPFRRFRHFSLSSSAEYFLSEYRLQVIDFFSFSSFSYYHVVYFFIISQFFENEVS